MQPKKSLGQNFLQSQGALNKIIEISNLTKDEVVLEIGPGRGALTEKILAKNVSLIAVEKDNELIELLEDKFSKEINENHFELINKDILEFDEKTLPKKYKLIANIPYYITGLIIRKFLSSENQPKQAVLLVQKEVAMRIINKPELVGSDKNPKNKENLLSMSVKIYAEPRYVKTVPAGSFVPAPNVDSAIISLEKISKDKLQLLSKKIKLTVEQTEEIFFEFIHAGFSHKRKTLFKNFKESDSIKERGISKENILTAFNKNELNPNIRAEDLSLENWLCLIENLI
jgi:16S rRNA (adenine1518-N6/adenine1519-N6)-dimethyltransferase